MDLLKPAFNMNPRAQNSLGRKLSPETRLKLRTINLGKKLSPENKAIAIKNLIPNRKGLYSHSQATKDKMSLTRQVKPPIGMTGKTHTDEARLKISNASAKTYSFLNPSNQLVMVTNLKKFCQKNNLIRFHLYAVHSGQRKSHKGWTKAMVSSN